MKNTVTATEGNNVNQTFTYAPPRSDSVPGGNATDARPLIDNAHPLAGRHPLEQYTVVTKEGVEFWVRHFNRLVDGAMNLIQRCRGKEK